MRFVEFDSYFGVLIQMGLVYLAFILLDLILTVPFRWLAKRIKFNIPSELYLVTYMICGALVVIIRRWKEIFPDGQVRILECGWGHHNYNIYLLIPLFASVFFIWGRIHARSILHEKKRFARTSFYVSIPFMIIGAVVCNLQMDENSRRYKEELDRSTFSYSLMELNHRKDKKYPITPWPNRPTEIEE